jgi:nitroreductase
VPELVRDLVIKSRSCRRFDESQRIDRRTLEALVDLARLSPSAANRQPLKYALSCDPASNARVFPHLVWAGYLKDWPGPSEGERPTAYIVIVGDSEIGDAFGCDHGIAAQSIMLGATELGLAGCMVGSIRHNALREAMGIPNGYEILLAIALGKPSEKIVIDEVGPDGDVRYWRDEKGVHHVPKRSLGDVIL